MRKLVTIRRVNDVLPIDGADAIELIKVDGWGVIAKKGEFQKDDQCVYFEIDSFLPVQPHFEFLRKSSFRRMGEREGFRIKTIRLRKQLSQGLVLPVDDDLRKEWAHSYPPEYDGPRLLKEGDDLSELFGVVKYEPPIPVELAGQVRGPFPAFIQRTDQERCQNIVNEIFVDNEDSRYEITTKMDGTSFTGFHVDGEEGVCSRNWELSLNEANANNTLVRMFVNSGLRDALREIGVNYAVQGELMGPGIQSNRESLKEPRLYVFDIFDIDEGKYLPPHRRHEVLDQLWSAGTNTEMVHHVPVVGMAESLEDLNVYGVDSLLKFAEGPSIVHPVREGLVFKRVDGGFSFKAISTEYLLKEKD